LWLWGHTVKLLPAQHVKPFVIGHKSDRNDAVTIAEASRRPNINSVPIKSLEQQDIQTLHRIRERHISQKTALMNQARGLLAEYGIICPIGHKAFCTLLREVTAPETQAISGLIKTQFNQVADEYYAHVDSVEDIDRTLRKIIKNNPLCELLMTIPGVGIINCTAIYSAIGNGSQFKNAREFAVWLGLTPKQSSSGDCFKSGGITKRGNRYLRKQLVHGARAVISRCKNKTDRVSCWANKLIERRGYNKACVAMAARTPNTLTAFAGWALARTVWVILNKKETYKVAV
jgi:transposase